MRRLQKRVWTQRKNEILMELPRYCRQVIINHYLVHCCCRCIVISELMRLRLLHAYHQAFKTVECRNREGYPSIEVLLTDQ